MVRTAGPSAASLRRDSYAAGVSDVRARRVFAATALCVLAGIVIQLFVAADNTGGHFTDADAPRR